VLMFFVCFLHRGSTAGSASPLHLRSDRAHPTCRPPSSDMCAAGPSLCSRGVKQAQLKTAARQAAWHLGKVSRGRSRPRGHTSASAGRVTQGSGQRLPDLPSATGFAGLALIVVSFQSTYNQHTINIQSTYNQHTVNIQSTYSQHNHQTILNIMV